MQLEGKSGLSIVEACDAARVSKLAFTATLMNMHLGRQTRNCAVSSIRFVWITAATVHGG